MDELKELLAKLAELIRGGLKFEEIETAFTGNPDTLKIWNKVKGLGESAQWNKVKDRIETAEAAVTKLTEEKTTLEAQLSDLKKKGDDAGDDAAEPYRKQVETLTASLDEVKAQLREKEIESEWAAVLDLVAGGEGDSYHVNRDYFDVLKTRHANAVGFTKGAKPKLELMRDGAAIAEVDGKSPRVQLAEYLREQVPESFRVVKSTPGGGINPGGGGGNPDAAFFKEMATAGAAAGKAVASSDGMRKLAGLE